MNKRTMIPRTLLFLAILLLLSVPALGMAEQWKPTSTSAPTEKYSHTPVWTGSQMILWGKHNGSEFNTGGCYTP